MTKTPITAYCVKCKATKSMQAPEAVYTKVGTPGTRGTCVDCGTKMFKMGYTPAHDDVPKPKTEFRPRRSRKGKKSSTKAEATKRRRQRNLVIVESPAKARTIGKFLGKKYIVKASVGHIRDLLRSQLSVDVENDFAPKYRIPNEKRPVVKELKSDAANAGSIFLATDSDREGEAIAWHLMEAIGLEADQVKRVIFHEITKSAIDEAFANPRNLEMDRVNAQQARRILDRLVGYQISPLLWKRVRSRTSAGRVQSVALRLISEREEEIDNFVREEYWTIDANVSRQDKLNGDAAPFLARVMKKQGQALSLPNQAATDEVLAHLNDATYRVAQVKRGQRRRKPQAPFITSTLQQEASRKLGFGTRKTMRVAQQLYEGVELTDGDAVGLITYMRTDSPNIAAEAQQAARDFITKRHGAEFIPETPPVYKSRAKGAQEAHEAIRPTAVMRLPVEVKGVLSRDQYRLYNLIWLRFIASQMSAALYETMRIDMEADVYALRTTGARLVFSGFLSVYEEAKDEDSSESDNTDTANSLPDLSAGDTLTLHNLLPEQHFTQPPPRFTEASLVRTLEEFGIGRPSTYAPTISTIQERGYVELSEKRLYPTELGNIVNNLLVDYFPEVINVSFTAQMEAELDKIAWEGKNWVAVLSEFYTPFSEALADAEVNMPTVSVANESIGEACPKCEHDLVIKYGRYGKFIACSNFPECRYTRPFVKKLDIACPTCETGELVERKTQKGRIFYGCNNYPDCEWTSWKRPLATPCPTCGGLLIAQNKSKALCTTCDTHTDLATLTEKEPEAEPA